MGALAGGGEQVAEWGAATSSVLDMYGPNEPGPGVVHNLVCRALPTQPTGETDIK